MKSILPLLSLIVATGFDLASFASAQDTGPVPATRATTATGAITGRVFNPTTGEYIRNAEVRITGTPLVAISEDGGYFRLSNAPAGPVTVVATYTGHETATAQVNVAPGG